ncbi:MAG: MFS transporter [Patulibacter sp.]|nr:MFS transporter [Patulibacter sp.]
MSAARRRTFFDAPHDHPALAGLLLGAFLVPASLGITAVSISMAEMSAGLGLTEAEAVWALAGYVLAHAISLAALGRLGDTHGVATVLRIGLVLLVVGTVMTAAATSLVTLTAGRLVQGFGAGGTPVAVFAITGLRFSGPARVAVLATVTAMIGIVSGAGALIGGAVTDLVSWRVAVALPVLSVLSARWIFRLAPPAAAGGQGVDVYGAGLMAVWAGAFVLLLETPSIALPPALIAGLVLVVGITTVLQARRVRMAPSGFLPRAVVGSRRYVLGALAAMTTYSVYVALLFAAPLLLLQAHDWSATTVGLVLFPAALVGAISARIVGRLVLRFNPFRVASGLAATSMIGMLITGAADGAPVMTTVGLSFVLTGFIASQGGLLSHVPMAVAPEVRSVATGIFQLTALIGGAMGSAAVAGLSTPLGLSGAVTALAVVPAAGILLALLAGRAPVDRIDGS